MARLMAGVRNHRRLHVWQLAHEARLRIRVLTKKPGFRDHLWLRSQLRKAANSACANTGEGFSRFRPKQFLSFLEIAKSSLTEILEHMDDVLGYELATKDEYQEICSFVRRARGAANGLILYLRSAKAPEPATRPRRREGDEGSGARPAP
jgi:four helix bundle protein